MANDELDPRDWRDIQVLRAQGVLAEVHTVDLDQADRGLRAYAALSGVSLHTVVRQVVDQELTISRELCVSASRAGRRPGVDQEAARADVRASRRTDRRRMVDNAPPSWWQPG